MNRFFAVLFTACFLTAIASAPAEATSRKSSEGNKASSTVKLTKSVKTGKKTVVASSGKVAAKQKRRPTVQAAAPAKPSFGQLAAAGTASSAIPAFANVDPPRMFQISARLAF